MNPLLSFICRALLVMHVSLACAQTPGTNESGPPRFDLMEFDVQGNSVLPAAVIESVLYPFLGPGKSIEVVEQARSALEKVYQDRGFITVSVDIPEQKVDGGLVILQVMEGRVGRSTTRGGRYFASSDIRRVVTEANEGTVLNAKTLQAQLGLVNRGADVSVQPMLKPGKTPGTVDVELNIDDKLPVHGSVSLSNYNTLNTTNARLSGEVRYDNFMRSRHSLGVSAMVSPQNLDELRILTLTYIMPFIDRSTGLFYLVDSDSNTVAAAGTLLVNGKFTVFGGRYLVPAPEIAKWRTTLSAGFDYKRNVIATNLGGSGEPLYYLPLTLGLNSSRSEGGNTWRLDANINLNPGIVGSDQAVWTSRRVLGSNPSIGITPEFATLRLDLGHDRPLDKSGWRLRSRLAGQYTNQPVINLEQMALGGNDSSRAYFESEALGDRGIRGMIEIASPNFANDALKSKGAQLSGVAFLEGGIVRTIDPLATQPSSQRLVSLGFGMRSRLSRQLLLNLDLARAMVDGPFTRSGDFRATARTAFEF
jgi:hemolysin activation/secretion protein